MLILLKIAVFTQGVNVPSTRFRVLQYIDLFNKSSIDVQLYHAYRSAYPPEGFFRRCVWILTELFVRLIQIVKVNFSDVDVVILQRELISTLPTLERLITKKVILDVDDAIFLYKNGVAARVIAKASDAIVCGNSYLSDYFSKINYKVHQICTPVDTGRFITGKVCTKTKYIGWSGSSSGFHYLYDIETELKNALNRCPGWKLLVVADRCPEFKILESSDFEFEKWHPEIEVNAIQKMSIGLMPLSNDNWSRGKCSYKMLLYMSCGVPCIVSDVGMNKEILALGQVGFGVAGNDNWADAICKLVENPELRNAFGAGGRVVVETHYSLLVAAKKWVDVISAVSKT